ncbi:MAG: SPASM domain-containing protein [Theionarchaea archaeon]|nr:SPASM domain-containing protein [Theionarchaea archaeon]MBU7040348.1 SPASM domain-containing protein [Theionarchaea archaeon]
MTVEVTSIGDHVSIDDDATHLLFNTADSGLYRIELITRKLLVLIHDYGIEAARSLIKEDDIENVAEEKLSELKENKFLDPLPEFVPQETSPIMFASLNVSHDCNLNCRYCYGGGGTYAGDPCHMSTDVGELAVDRLFEWCDDSELLGINFFGGEPLLNVKLIQHLVSYATERAHAEEKKVRFSMTSNGTLFTDEIVAFLKESNIGVLVSMDGPKHVQDVNRPFRNGKGSYDVIADRLQSLLAVRPHLTARATLTKDCMSLSTLVDGLRDVGFTYVHVEPLTPYENCPFALSEEDFETLKDEYDKLGHIFLENILNGTPFGFSNILRTLSAIYTSGVRHYPCGAGKNLMAVDPMGGIYICHRFVGMEDFSMGTLNDPDFSIQKRLLQAHVDARDECRNCWARHLCAGSCWYDNYVYSGAIDRPHSPRCSLFKHIAALSMVIFSKLHEKDKALLDKMFRKHEPSYRRGEFPEDERT